VRQKSYDIFHFSFFIGHQRPVLRVPTLVGFFRSKHPAEVGTLNLNRQWQMRNGKLWKMGNDLLFSQRTNTPVEQHDQDRAAHDQTIADENSGGVRAQVTEQEPD
jgi:hypothetical protein